MEKVEITEWDDFKKILIRAGYKPVGITRYKIHVLSFVKPIHPLMYKTGVIVSVKVGTSYIYSIVASALPHEKVKEELKIRGIEVSPAEEPSECAMKYAKVLREDIEKQLNEITKEHPEIRFEIVGGFYGLPQWVDKLMDLM